MSGAPLQRGRRAVVIGASMAGLCAARVLSDHFEEVAVVERDRLPLEPALRRGAPQARHIHAVLAGGAQGLEALFPGFREELATAGVQPVDFLNEVAFYQRGWLGPAPGRRLEMFFPTRPLLEWLVAARVRALPAVEILEGRRVTALAWGAEEARVAGVELDGGEGLAADLVVDASGRGSRTPRWLRESGGVEVPVERVELPLAYTSQWFRPPTARPAWKALFVMDEPGCNRAGGIFPIEGDRWLVTLIGVAGERAPDETGCFRDFARGLASPALHEAIETAEPLSPPSKTYRFQASLRRRYERAQLPERLVVIGDAVCSFDPRFGQGFSVAILEAQALGRALARQGMRRTASMAREIGRVAGWAWAPVVAEDLRHPAARGRRSGIVRAMQWYSGRALERQAADPALQEALWRVSQLVERPTALLRPSVLRRVLAPR